MNSLSPGTDAKRPFAQSRFACSMRSRLEATKFHQMWRGVGKGSPPSSITRELCRARSCTVSPRVSSASCASRSTCPSIASSPASRTEIQQRVEELLKRVQLEEFDKRYPSQLSGGQRQRIALARALAIEPRVLLLDEPFGALDAKVRKELRRWLRQFHEETHLTSIFVTHDQEEAFEVADRVVILSDGVIQQESSPDEVTQNPANDFVTEFLDKE